MLSSTVQVVKYDPKYRTAFYEMNAEWIQKYFALEPADIRQLENPEGTIISPGGEIFFVLEENLPVGTCAMLASGPGRYELAKMAVTPAARGKHYGDRLMEAVLTWARSKKATEVFLLSNTDLEAAIALYLKNGFGVASLGKHPDYDRCNIHMVKTL
jgi:GNAT superfamily N-acetyltransferase